MKTINSLLLTLLLAVCPYSDALSQTTADSLTVTVRSNMLGIGATRVLDTYLSQEHFSGLGLSFVSTSEYLRPGRYWSTVVEHEADVSSVHDRADNRDELEGAYNLYLGRLRTWKLLDDRLTLQAGGVANVTAGVIYNTANGNNPAQARFALNVMPMGTASYRFQLGSIPFMARCELAAHLVGIRFSPNYGQSYYEIFSCGDYDHNVVPTTTVSAPEWRTMLTLDARLSRRFTLRIGYLGNFQQADVNNLKQHVYTHRVLIGITKRFSIATCGLNNK